MFNRTASLLITTLVALLLATQLTTGQNRALIDSLSKIAMQTTHDSTMHKVCLQIANQYKKANNDSALLYLNIALDAAKKLNDTTAIIQAHDGFYSWYSSQRDIINKFMQNLKIIELAEEAKDTSMWGTALMQRGRMSFDLGMEEEWVKYTLKSIELAEKIGDNEQFGYRNYLMGWCCFNRDNKEEALHYFKIAKEAYEKLGNTKKIMQMKGWMGLAYSSLGEMDLALQLRKEFLDYALQEKSKHQKGEAYRYLSNVYTKMHKYDTAITLLEKSIEHFNEAGALNRSALMVYLIAINYEKLGDYENAAKQLNRLFAPENNYTDLLSNYLGRELASTVYEKVGQPLKALESLRQYIVLGDSLDQTEQANTIIQNEMVFELEKEQQRLEMEGDKRQAVAQEEIRRQKLMGYALMGGLALLLIVVFLIYRNLLQKKKTNKVIVDQHSQLEEKNKEVLDSINYAKRIQDAILPKQEEVKSIFNEMFVLYIPRDIVSGDFYWINENKNYKTLVVADCTGHGVPGGFMSMLGFEMLQEISVTNKVDNTAEIFRQLDKKVVETLNKPGSSQNYHDGMDALVCMFSKKEKKLLFTGANRPLIRVRNGELEEFKPDKFSIGGAQDSSCKLFYQHEIPYETGDCFYLYSDGFQDQFGGPKGKKFMHKQLKAILVENAALPMKKQHEKLENIFHSWRNGIEQVDDICVVGVKV